MLDTVKNLTQEDFARFYLYCMEWYAPDSKHHPDYTPNEILWAVMAVMSRDTQYYTAERIMNFPFEGDSMDRWAVRYLMDHKRGVPLEEQAPSKEMAESQHRNLFGQLLTETTTGDTA